jgi:hypothetical protein
MSCSTLHTIATQLQSIDPSKIHFTYYMYVPIQNVILNTSRYTNTVVPHPTICRHCRNRLKNPKKEEVQRSKHLLYLPTMSSTSSPTMSPLDCFANATKLIIDASLINPRCASGVFYCRKNLSAPMFDRNKNNNNNNNSYITRIRY